MCVLAQRYGQGPVTLDSICAERDLPKQYLTKIFSSLSRAGLVNPIRGKRGGYLLSREPGQVSLLQIIEAVQGPIALNFCTQDPPQCDRDNCPLRSMWQEMQEQVVETLSQTTLEKTTPQSAMNVLSQAPQSSNS